VADYLTYLNLQDEIERGIKKAGGSLLSLVKSTINMVYLNEIISCDPLHPLFWLVDFDDSLAAKAPATITAITAANPGVVTCDDAHGFVENDIVGLYNIVGMTELNYRMVKVGTVGTTTTANDNFQLKDLDGTNINTSALTAYSSGGTVHHRGLTLATSGKNVQKILDCKWLGEGKEGFMSPITIDELKKSTLMDSFTARPKRYEQRKTYGSTGTETNQLLWYNAADAIYPLKYWFVKRCSPLDGDTDVPNLPPQFHHAIIAGALTRLAENNAQVENAVIWPGIYRQQLEAIKTFNREYYDRHGGAPYRDAPYML